MYEYCFTEPQAAFIECVRQINKHTFDGWRFKSLERDNQGQYIAIMEKKVGFFKRLFGR